jgi:hypothetical protein
VCTGRAYISQGGDGVDFVAVVDQVSALLRQRGRVAYRTLKVQCTLDDDALEALKDELLYAQQLARDEDDRILVWIGDAQTPPAPPPSSSQHASPPATPSALASVHTGYKLYLKYGIT